MNRDVFLSLLAMDSYNRGYNPGVAKLPDLGGIGTANIIDIPLPAGSVAAGFYAIAYNWNGEKVISYRGTDPSNFGQLYRDLAHGWSTFTGLGNSSESGSVNTVLGTGIGAAAIGGILGSVFGNE